jgi:hypothetical protein
MQTHRLPRRDDIRLLRRVGIAMLALIVAADLVVAQVPHFGVDASVAFNAWYGFSACAVLMAVAKYLGALLARRDDYYDEYDA